MTFDELLDAGRRAESIDDVAGLWDELAAVAGQTLDGYNATTAELEGRIAELEAEQVRLMAENYKLMTAMAAADTEAEDEVDDEETEDEVDDEGEDSIEDYIEED